MDITEIKTPYDLVETILDHTKITGRPVEWDAEIIDGEGHIADGSMATPMRFESACPHCAQMISFNSGFEEIKCPECGRGKDVKIFVLDPFQDPGKYAVTLESPETIEAAMDGAMDEAAVEATADMTSEWEPSDVELDAAIDNVVEAFSDVLDKLEMDEI